MEIPEINNLDIGIRNIDINQINVQPVNDWLIRNPPMALPIYPPVTSVVGTPIVNMPGCVEAHQESDKNTNLKDEDRDGTRVYCDAGTPSFNPMDYDASRLDLEMAPPEAPPVKGTEPPKQPKPPATPSVPKDAATKGECPNELQRLTEPVGKVIGDERVVEYRLVGTQCIAIKEKLDIPTQIIENLPSAGMTTATVAVAVTATTSALLAKPLADLLLKVVKPVTKKVLKKIATLRGKKLPTLSSSERQAEQRQRNEAVKKLRSVRPLKK